MFKSRIPINKSNRNDQYRKSPLERHHFDDYGKKESLIDVHRGQKYAEKKDICIVSKYSPLRYLLTTQTKLVTFQVEKLVRHCVNLAIT